MAATITLIDPKTGKQHEVVDKYLATTDVDDWAWNWTDGNWACDCNRKLELMRAGVPGYENAMDEVDPCGDTIKMVKIVADDGRVLYPFEP